MSPLDEYEKDILAEYDAGHITSVATKEELERLRAIARATAKKDRRVNIRLSSVDLDGIQARAMEEGMPYQTLITSIIHKYVSGRLVDRTTSELQPSSVKRGRGAAGAS